MRFKVRDYRFFPPDKSLIEPLGHRRMYSHGVLHGAVTPYRILIQPDAQEGDRGVLLDFASSVIDSSGSKAGVAVSRDIEVAYPCIDPGVLVGLSGVLFARGGQGHRERPCVYPFISGRSRVLFLCSLLLGGLLFCYWVTEAEEHSRLCIPLVRKIWRMEG